MSGGQNRRVLPIGFRSHMLVVLSDLGSVDGTSMASVRCDCGNELAMSQRDVERGRIKSCGCFRKQRAEALNLRHGEARKGQHSAEYKTWVGMIKRCTQPGTHGYERYGSRGIRVCDRWMSSFDAFVQDVGRKPTQRHTLERRDPDGNYEPGNVRWATKTEQDRNKRTTRWITVDGQRKSLAQWSEETGIDRVTITERLRRGWTPEEAVRRKP